MFTNLVYIITISFKNLEIAKKVNELSTKSKKKYNIVFIFQIAFEGLYKLESPFFSF